MPSNAYAPNVGGSFIPANFVPPRRPVTRVFLHHSASKNTNLGAEDVHRMHLEQDWSAIGYHFFITTGGEIQVGRDLEYTPAAQPAGNNARTIAVCVNGAAGLPLAGPQRQALRGLAEAINLAYDGEVTFHGHREVASTECPSYDYRAILALDSRGRMSKSLTRRIDRFLSNSGGDIKDADLAAYLELCQDIAEAKWPDHEDAVQVALLNTEGPPEDEWVDDLNGDGAVDPVESVLSGIWNLLRG